MRSRTARAHHGSQLSLNTSARLGLLVLIVAAAALPAALPAEAALPWSEQTGQPRLLQTEPPGEQPARENPGMLPSPVAQTGLLPLLLAAGLLLWLALIAAWLNLAGR